MTALEQLRSDFGGQAAFYEKRPGIYQILAPIYHEDGDMIDMFLTEGSGGGNAQFRISDYGMTLMRLSYSLDVETPARQRILHRILNENGISEQGGQLFLDTQRATLYPAVLQFAQAVAKVSNMEMFKREIVHSLFYETLNDFIIHSLTAYHPEPNYLPAPSRDELEVDWRFAVGRHDIFLYGVRDSAKARLAALACREFQLLKLPFRSVIVHEDFETGLSKKDQSRITNAADKQYTTLPDFIANAESFFAREAA